MKVAVAQVRCSPGDISLNCELIPYYAKLAQERGSEVVVFPEMVDTGYDMSAIEKTASPWTGLPFMTAKFTAAACSMYVICGLSEREGEKIFNSVAVIDPNGNLIGKYRKTHLFSPDPLHEGNYITAGDSLEMVQIGDIRIGFLICYDLRFPEVSRHLCMMGADVLVICAAWPFQRESHWKILTMARAIENQCYVVAANRVGADGPLTFCGSSCMIDPNGTVISVGLKDCEELLVGEVSPEIVASCRNTFPFQRDRREDLYNWGN